MENISQPPYLTFREYLHPRHTYIVWEQQLIFKPTES